MCVRVSGCVWVWVCIVYVCMCVCRNSPGKGAVIFYLHLPDGASEILLGHDNRIGTCNILVAHQLASSFIQQIPVWVGQERGLITKIHKQIYSRVRARTHIHTRTSTNAHTHTHRDKLTDRQIYTQLVTCMQMQM